jgi:hypothetical protein
MTIIRAAFSTLTTLGAVAVLAACGSSGTSGGTTTNSPVAASATTPVSTPAGTSTGDPAPLTSDYRPVIDPATFSADVTNRYYPLVPGTTRVYDGTRDGVAHHGEVAVTNEVKTIMGVPCRVIRDVVTSNGALVEKTTDWYTQAADGSVWYFGEATAEYENGAVVSTKGSWEAGVDGAQPGVIMKAAPTVGDRYRQEYRPGEAEDQARIRDVAGSVRVPAGAFAKVIVTDDIDPLNPAKSDVKYFAPDTGLVYTTRDKAGHSEEMSLVKVVTG